MPLPYSASRRRALQLGAAASLSPWLMVSAHAEITSLNEAINKAGRQRMLSQRMAKAWLAKGQGITPVRAEKIMLDSMALFDRQVIELKAYAPSPEIKATYAALEPIWSHYKTALIGQSPAIASAAGLLALDSQVLKLAHQGTVQLEKYSGRPIATLVNMAGRQRMLSQRTAKFYLSLNWGAEAPNASQDLSTAREEFAIALQTLTRAPETTAAIRQELGLAQQQWVFFDNALSMRKEKSGANRRARDVFSTSEHILDIMDKVTGMYSKLT